jgi:hypothetical protein
MPRMNIFNTVEREAFNSPPVFSSSNASSILTSPPSYAASPLASAIRPTSLAFYSAQATSKPRGGSSHQALSTRGISSMWRASSSPERVGRIRFISPMSRPSSRKSSFSASKPTQETSPAADPATVFDRVNRFPSHPQIISDRPSPFANNVLPFPLNLRGAAHIRK